jgi:hypothetical protein
MSIKTDEETPKAAPFNKREAWLNCTEDLIFAAAYYGDEHCRSVAWRRALDLRGIRHNEQDEDRKCAETCAAIDRMWPNLRTHLERAHAANAHPTFRLQRMGNWPTEDALVLANGQQLRRSTPRPNKEQADAARARCGEIMARMGL